MALIHSNISFSGYAILDDKMPEEGEADFDRAQMRILFRGTESALRLAFPKGAANYAGVATMICAGVRVEKSRFGFLWAVVLWTGILNEPVGLVMGSATLQMGVSTVEIKSVTNNASTVELSLPQTVAGGGEITAAGIFNASNIALRRSRSRLIYPAWSRDYSGVMIVPRNAPPVQPKLLSGGRPLGLPITFNSAPATDGAAIDVSQCNWFDGINASDIGGGGWCLRNFQAGSVIILGGWMLVKWTASFEWIDRFSIA